MRAVHERVVGAGYQADDPALLLWVHATLVDTALRVHKRFLRPLRADDAERYYEESTVVAELLGVPRAAQPPDLAAFRDYVRDDGRLASRSATPPAAWRATCSTRGCPGRSQPVAELGRQLTAGLLPAPLREQYGLSWDAHRKRALLLAGWVSPRAAPRAALVRRVQ